LSESKEKKLLIIASKLLQKNPAKRMKINEFVTAVSKVDPVLAKEFLATA
jgi:hypothetical protein